MNMPGYQPQIPNSVAIGWRDADPDALMPQGCDRRTCIARVANCYDNVLPHERSQCLERVVRDCLLCLPY